MTRILVTGAGGFLGHILCEELARRHTVFAGLLDSPAEGRWATPVHLDVTDEGEVRSVLAATAPDVVVHCAARANPDECEQHPHAARAVNVEGTRNIGRACRQQRRGHGFRV